MEYQIFERVAVRVETPILSIVPGGRIAINSAAGRLLMDAGSRPWSYSGTAREIE
jgi:hypothetical protein